MFETDENWMREALRAAAKAELAGEVPIGCVIVRDGEIVAAVLALGADAPRRLHAVGVALSAWLSARIRSSTPAPGPRTPG